MILRFGCLSEVWGAFDIFPKGIETLGCSKCSRVQDKIMIRPPAGGANRKRSVVRRVFTVAKVNLFP